MVIRAWVGNRCLLPALSGGLSRALVAQVKDAYLSALAQFLAYTKSSFLLYRKEA